MKNKTLWIFNDGVTKHDYTTFPYAFRAMYRAFKKGLEAGKTHGELASKFSIISPLKKVYSYYRANDLATDQGLLTTQGELNDREFRIRKK